MEDDGLATALAFADEYTATNALVDALKSDPAVESELFGDMLFFDRPDTGEQLVYDAGENRFWTTDEYADSPFAQIADENINKATVYRQTAGDALEPATYTMDRFEDEMDLFSRAYQQEYDGLIVLHTDDDEPVVYDRLEERFWSTDEYRDSLYHVIDAIGNESRFREMLDDVYDAVRETENYCNVDYDRIKGVPTTMGFAAYGEGFVLGKVHGSNIRQEEYLMTHVTQDPETPQGASPDEIKRVRFTKSTLPGNTGSRSKQRFARDYIFSIHADNPATPGVFYIAYNPGTEIELDDIEHPLPVVEQ